MSAYFQDGEFYLSLPSVTVPTLSLFLLLHSSVHSSLPSGRGGRSVKSECIPHPHYTGPQGGTKKRGSDFIYVTSIYRFQNYHDLCFYWRQIINCSFIGVFCKACCSFHGFCKENKFWRQGSLWTISLAKQIVAFFRWIFDFIDLLNNKFHEN